DHENEVVRGALILEGGERRWPPPPKPATGPLVPVPSVQKAQPVHQKPPPPKTHPVVTVGVLAFLGLFLLGLGFVAPPAFLGHFTVFVLACFIGWQVVWNVTPALHTPLMSVTNAISGIILIGGMLQVSGPLSSPVTILAAIAILLATINVGGGFLVTQRMLSMFQR
ncbi:MAG: proton-translocating transhydrogenase family protein, partial [Polyangiaceae bacterium]